MFRVTVLAGFVFASTGCAGTWDTITSRQFREHPWQTTKRMVSPEDPVAVLLADPPRDGHERVDALRRLKEPARDGRPPEEQDAVLAVVARAAASDPSPVLRMEAVAALGRFEDVRAVRALMVAYQNAHGRGESEPAPPPPPPAPGGGPQVVSAGRTPTRGTQAERFPITGPTGFAPEIVASLRCRAADALGRTNRPEAAKFLATVAGGAGAGVAMDGAEDRDVRLAAIRGLGRCRQPESVAALAEVLKVEAANRDAALIGRTHEGLVRLTGKQLPPDPQQWSEVVQAGVVIAPEPTWLETVIDQAMFWQK